MSCVEGVRVRKMEKIYRLVDFLTFRVICFLSAGRYGFRRFSGVERWSTPVLFQDEKRKVDNRKQKNLVARSLVAFESNDPIVDCSKDISDWLDRPLSKCCIENQQNLDKSVWSSDQAAFGGKYPSLVYTHSVILVFQAI